MRTLITGASGVLGRALVENLLLRTSWPLSLVVRPGSDATKLRTLVDRFPERDARVLEVPLLAEPLGGLLPEMELVFHLAASMKGDVASIFRNTVGGTLELLDALRAQPRRPRLVLVSSFSVYGPLARAGEILDEGAPLEPNPARRDPYAHAKFEQERLCREAYVRESQPLAIARPGVIYGPGYSGITYRVGLRLGPLFLHLGGKNPLPMTFVDNCADALRTIGEHGRFEGEAYNIVDDGTLDAAGYLDRARRHHALRVIHLPRSAGFLLAWGLEHAHRLSRGRVPKILTRYQAQVLWQPQEYDNAAIKALGWTPPVDLATALSRTFDPARPL